MECATKPAKISWSRLLIENGKSHLANQNNFLTFYVNQRLIIRLIFYLFWIVRIQNAHFIFLEKKYIFFSRDDNCISNYLLAINELLNLVKNAVCANKIRCFKEQCALSAVKIWGCHQLLKMSMFNGESSFQCTEHFSFTDTLKIKYSRTPFIRTLVIRIGLVLWVNIFLP